MSANKERTFTDMLSDYFCKHELLQMIEARDSVLKEKNDLKAAVKSFGIIMGASCKKCKKTINGLSKK